MVSPSQRLFGLPRELQTVQDNLAGVLDLIAKVQIVDGVRLEDVALVSGSDQLVAHKLGRAPLGWFTVKRNADCRLWETALDANHLTLRTSANVTVTLWVF